MIVKILRYKFSNFWWGFDMAHRLAWPIGLPTTLICARLLISVRTNLIARVSYIPGHEIRMVSYALWDGGNCRFY